MTRKLTVSRPQDSQIVPAPQWSVAVLPTPAPSANSSTTPKYVSALWSISLLYCFAGHSSILNP